MRKLRGAVIAILMFLTSYLGTLFMQGPFFWLMFVAPALFRAWIDMTMNLWMKFTGSLMHRVAGIKIREFGDHIRPGERAVYVLNHRTRLDFMYFWTSLSRFGTCYQEKIVLKNGLNKIPGAGWAMQAAGFIFLVRKWEMDEETFTNYLKYFYKVGQKPQILIFPEGTDFCPASKQRSHSYAEKNGLPKYEYVLHPRTTGFIHLLNRMAAEGGVEAVYDITVAYPCDFPTSELQFAAGRIPAEVHYEIKRYDAASLGDDAEKINWLTKVFAEKEERLSSFYNDKNMFDNEIYPQVPVLIEASIFVYWILYIIIVIYAVCTSWPVFIYFIIANIVCIYYSNVKGGFQKHYMEPVLSAMRRSD